LDTQFRGKKKRFGDSSVVGSSNQQTYGDPGVWVGVLMSKAFRPQCCTIIGAGAPRATGHAVAVHQRDPNEWSQMSYTIFTKNA
jgi:hypothetical protein